MLEALRKTGWHNYSLYLTEDGLLFGYVETPNGLEAAIAGMSKEEVNQRWQDFMAPYFEALEGKHADEGMAELEEVFHLD
jgi:L-rhamnose mutarotase